MRYITFETRDAFAEKGQEGKFSIQGTKGVIFKCHIMHKMIFLARFILKNVLWLEIS